MEELPRKMVGVFYSMASINLAMAIMLTRGGTVESLLRDGMIPQLFKRHGNLLRLGLDPRRICRQNLSRQLSWIPGV